MAAIRSRPVLNKRRRARRAAAIQSERRCSMIFRKPFPALRITSPRRITRRVDRVQQTSPRKKAKLHALTEKRKQIITEFLRNIWNHSEQLGCIGSEKWIRALLNHLKKSLRQKHILQSDVREWMKTSFFKEAVKNVDSSHSSSSSEAADDVSCSSSSSSLATSKLFTKVRATPSKVNLKNGAKTVESPSTSRKSTKNASSGPKSMQSDIAPNLNPVVSLERLTEGEIAAARRKPATATSNGVEMEMTSDEDDNEEEPALEGTGNLIEPRGDPTDPPSDTVSSEASTVIFTANAVPLVPVTPLSNGAHSSMSCTMCNQVHTNISRFMQELQNLFTSLCDTLPGER